MKTIAFILIALVAALHAGILVLEMFYWDHPIGRDIFSMTEAESAATAVLAANQGLYNGFLAAGLAWSLISRKNDVAIFCFVSLLRESLGPRQRNSPSFTLRPHQRRSLYWRRFCGGKKLSLKFLGEGVAPHLTLGGVMGGVR
jgi:uncharacterized membrane protein